MKREAVTQKLDKAFHGVLRELMTVDGTERELLEKAYSFAARAHEGQQRLSGEPFITHSIEVVRILVELRLDAATVAAGMLHDVVEDTGVSLKEVEMEFGVEIAGLVEGLTELGKLAFRSPEERQVESARRMLVSMVKDIRVIFIKLADRLHNMRTLEFLPEERRRHIARETLEIYGPLAHRLGMGRIKGELEDISFKILEPDAFNSVRSMVRVRVANGEAVFERFHRPIEEWLRNEDIDAKITSRIKHPYSVWQKMQNKHVPIDHIYDILSMRIITKTVRDCYHALEIVHGQFEPIQERFKDYIAAPKVNMYQSIHTTVLDSSGNQMEIQIRTEKMHYTAEYGIAAHWIYKERGKAAATWNRWLEWISRAIDYQLELTDPAEFMQYLKTDIFQNKIYVFTPAGELKQLPVGSTPIDYAYTIHSDIGNHCSAVKVNGRLVPFDYQLKSGDRVEVVTSLKAEPHEKWLGKVKTSRARAKIRNWFRNKTDEKDRIAGKEILRSELRKRRLSIPKEAALRKLLKAFQKGSLDELYSSLARGKISTADVVDRISGENEGMQQEREQRQIESVQTLVGEAAVGVRIDGMDNIMVRYAKCCQPVPGDPVIGVITRGRGVSVHRAGCKNLKKNTEPERIIKVEWETHTEQRYLVSLIVTARDRVGLVAEISRRVKDLDTEVRSGHFQIQEGFFTLILLMGIADIKHLNDVMAEIRGIENVISVNRSV